MDESSGRELRSERAGAGEGTLTSVCQGKPKSIQQVPTQQTRRSNHLHHQSMVSLKRLIGACKQKDLAAIRAILSAQPELINLRDKHNRNLLHYTVILFKRPGGESLDDGGSRTAADSFSISMNDDDYNNDDDDDDDDDDAHDSEQGDYRTDNTDDEANNFDARRTTQCLACLNYLLDRCDQKLWWQQDSDGLSVLHLAVISANNALVRFLVYEHPYAAKYPLVSSLDNERHSPLHWAVITNNLECVELLIRSASGTKLIHEPDFNGATPVHYATQTSDYPRYRRQLRLMLRNVATDHKLAQASGSCSKSNSNSNSKTLERTRRRDESQLVAHAQTLASERLQSPNGSNRQRGKRRISQLKGAATLEVLEALLGAPQVDIECRDKDQRTPLLWAASSGNREAVLMLLAAGANPHACDANKLGALHCAASHGFTECLESLLREPRQALARNQRASLGGGSSAAPDNSNSGCCPAVNQPDNLNCTPLFYAVLSGNIDCVELLADGGAQLDWQDAKGRSACHFAALRGQLNALKLLRRRGANLWLANRQGDLPLHYAIKGGRHQVARWLLEHSPYENSVNAINNYGRAPVHLAVQRDDTEMLGYLLGRGANLNQLVRAKDRTKQHRRSIHNSSSPAQGEQQRQPAGQSTEGIENRYETALDMAKRLGHEASLRMLLGRGARAASQVMKARQALGEQLASSKQPPPAGNVRSLFDLQAAEGPSPIGFDTTSSSSATSPAFCRPSGTAGATETTLPRLSRPKPDSLPQSSDSSALSQNSLTSVRGWPSGPPPPAPPGGARALGASRGHPADGGESPTAAAPPPPPPGAYKGGISYNNERIAASIKCKLYEGQRSFPPLSTTGEPAPPLEEQLAGGRRGRHQSAPSPGQEIITNVNVYASPCPLASHAGYCCCPLRQRPPMGAKSGACCPAAGEDESATSDGPPSETSCDEAEAIPPDHDLHHRHHHRHAQQQQQQQQQAHWTGSRMPDLQPARPAEAQQQRIAQFHHSQQLSSRLPPSQSHEQHLPVILSDREEQSNTSGGETSNGRSPEFATSAAARLEPLGETRAIGSGALSPAFEEPRFDRAVRGPQPMQHHGQSPQHQRQSQVRSPVADYIGAAPMHGGHHYNAASAAKPAAATNQHQHRQQQQQQHCFESHHLPDFSQVKAKVDSHRTPQDSGFRSRSLSRQAAASKQPSRSVSRQTFTREQHQQRTRQSSQDSFELELRVERSIRKYKQEKRIFEELQGLKRSQIRSGRANEAVLVRRLVEHLRREQLAGSSDLLGMDTYSGAYTYKAYEGFLYDQLRKLSKSNCAKLSRSMRDFEQELRSSSSHFNDDEDDDNNHSDFIDEALDTEEQRREFLDEDMRADQELRRVIEGAPADGATASVGEAAPVVEPSATTPDDGLKVSQVSQQQQEELGSEAEKPSGRDLTSQPELEVRRSSVASIESNTPREGEREKSDSLQPGVSFEAERDEQQQQAPEDDEDNIVDKSLIEDEAESICSAIMVDALGNISHRSQSAKAAGETAATPDEIAALSDGDGASASAVASAIEESSEAKENCAPARRSRRRSVVNIGNKLEVIYHDVGIEIDPASDLAETGDESADGTDQVNDAAKVAEQSAKECTSMTEVKEEEEEEEESDVVGASEVGSQQEDERVAGRQQLHEGPAADTRRDEKSDESSTLKVFEEEENSRARTANRRASSPPGDIERPKSPADSWRRAGSVENGIGSLHVAEIKKVFNGYDLDEWHQKTRGKPSKVPPAEAGSSRQHKTKQVRRARRERSRLPGGRFRPRVDVDQIKRRWSRVKAVERERKRCISSGGQGRNSLEHIGFFAKSQPQLGEQCKAGEEEERNKVRTTDGPEYGDGVRHDWSESYNYKLLYEINTKSKRARREQLGRDQVWCQRKVVRIVDVRSLKRTLSLPESVMYSNDLLKRFNILKL